jgi:hypothetical protein
VSRISQCESCGNENCKETEIYDNLGVWEGQYPLLCWQCGIAAKLERERIIKLLEEHAVSVDEGGGCWCNCGKGFMRDWDYNEHLLTVIKGKTSEA